MERPDGRAFEEVTEIAATPEAVWSVLADVAGWPRWTPAYPEAAGSIGEGDSIALGIRMPGAKAVQRQRATVYRSERPRSLWFGASVFGGLLRATRYVEIAPAGTGSRVVNGEALAGLLGPLFVRLAGGAIVAALRQHGTGLKAAAERR